MGLSDFQKGSATLARLWELLASNLATTLFQDQAATTAVDTNGQFVRAWKSIDASATVMSCANTGNTYVASSTGGLPVVSMTQVITAGRVFTFSGLTPNDTNGLTIVMLLVNGASAYTSMAISGPGLGPTDFRNTFNVTPSSVSRGACLTTDGVFGLTDMWQTNVEVIVFRTRNTLSLGNASQFETDVRVNGQQRIRHSTIVTSTGTGNTWMVGGDNSINRVNNLKYNTIAVYDGWLSDSDVAAVEAYLGAKCSPALNITNTAAYAIPGVNIICVGNSIMNGSWLSRGWGLDTRILSRLGGATKMYNLGIGGQTTAQMITRAATNEDTIPVNGEFNILVYQEGGGNDLATDGNSSNAVTQVQTYLAARKATGKYQHIIAISPTDRTEWPGAVTQNQFNTGRAAIAAALDALVVAGTIDQHVNMVGDTCVVDGETFYIRPIGANGMLATSITGQHIQVACTPDRIHLSAEGYFFMFPPVLKALRKAINNWRNSNPGASNVKSGTQYRFEGSPITGSLSSSGGNRFAAVTPAAG